MLGILGWIGHHQPWYRGALLIFRNVEVVILVLVVDLGLLSWIGRFSLGKRFLAILIIVWEDGIAVFLVLWEAVSGQGVDGAVFIEGDDQMLLVLVVHDGCFHFIDY